MRRGSMPVVGILTAIVLALALAGSASAATNIVGEWSVQEAVFTGPDSVSPAPGTYQYTVTAADEFLVEDQQGNFSGHPYGNGQDAITGELTNNNVLFACANGCTNANQNLYDMYQGTLTHNGQWMEGIAADCPSPPNGGDPIYVSNWTANIGGAPPAPAPSTTSVNMTEATAICSQSPPSGVTQPHPTGTVTKCYRGYGQMSDSICVATVTDEAASPATPRGAVNFAVNGPGSLPDEATCTLVPNTSTTGTPSSCRVTFQPGSNGTPAGSTVPLQSSYVGNSNYKPSSDSSAAVIVGNPPPLPHGSPPTPPAPTLFSYAECEDWANSTGSPPPGVYTGPDGADVPQIERDVFCAQVGGLSLIQGGPFALTSTAGPAILGATFQHSFALYISVPAGFPAAAAQYLAWSNSMYAAYQQGMGDPPKPSYETLAKPVTPRVPKVRVKGSASQRKAAKELNSLIELLASSRGVAAAFTTTVDRAGGAKQAKNDAWEGRQTRLAITFAQKLVSDYTQLGSLTPTVAKLAAHTSGGSTGLSSAKLNRYRAQIARSGLTAAEQSRLRSLGYTATQIAALVAAARDKQVPTSAFVTSPAKMLANPKLAKEYKSLALFFHLWAKEPAVRAAAALH